jgi:NDP-sugar pyrophosphorylase family protein
MAILAGGLATRLRPITGQTPKVLIDVAGRPFAEQQLLLLREHGLERVVFLVGHMGELVRETIGDGRRFGLDVDYVFDGPRLLGTGGALRQALPRLGEAFFVMYGDSYLECDFRAVASAFEESRRAGLMTVYRNENAFDRSNVLMRAGQIVRYDKQGRTPDMRHIDYGLGVLHARAFAGYPDGEAFDLVRVYQDLLARGELAAFEVATRFYEIGSPEGLEETRAHLAERG